MKARRTILPGRPESADAIAGQITELERLEPEAVPRYTDPQAQLGQALTADTSDAQVAKFEQALADARRDHQRITVAIEALQHLLCQRVVEERKREAASKLGAAGQAVKRLPSLLTQYGKVIEPVVETVRTKRSMVDCSMLSRGHRATKQPRSPRLGQHTLAGCPAAILWIARSRCGRRTIQTHPRRS